MIKEPKVRLDIIAILAAIAVAYTLSNHAAISRWVDGVLHSSETNLSAPSQIVHNEQDGNNSDKDQDSGNVAYVPNERVQEALSKWSGKTSLDGTPLPFSELNRPTSEMTQNDDGTIEADNGWTICSDRLMVYFDYRGESVEHMHEIVEEYGFAPANCSEFWHDALDCGELEVIVPSGMSLDDAGAVLYGIEGVESVELSSTGHGYISFFNNFTSGRSVC